MSNPYRIGPRTITERMICAPDIYGAPGERHFLVGRGADGGKAKGLLLLSPYSRQFGYKLLPFVVLRVEDDQNLKKLDTTMMALRLRGIGKGPLVIRSNHPHESVGRNSPISPAGLLETIVINFDPAKQSSLQNLADGIRKVAHSGFDLNFVAFCNRHKLPSRISSVILQPLVPPHHNPLIAGTYHPYYSALIDTAIEKRVRVCVGYGLGSSLTGRRGEGIAHEYGYKDGRLVSLRGPCGHQRYFEYLDPGTGAVDSAEIGEYDYDQGQRILAFLKNPRNFLRLAKIGLGLSHKLSLPGQGICLEAALSEAISLPYLLQLNHAARISLDYARPDHMQRIFLTTSSVIGQSHKVIEKVIVVIPPDKKNPLGEGINLQARLRELNQLHSDYLLIVPGILTSRGMGTAMSYNCFSKAAAVLEYESSVHETGSGMDHFSRLCRTGEIAYIETSCESFEELNRSLHLSLAETSLRPGIHLLSDLQLGLWVDEEAKNGRGEGIIYQPA